MAKPIHVVLTGQPRERYDSQGRPMGSYVPRVQKQTGHMCDIILHLRKEYDAIAKRYKYVATLKKCRFQRGFECEIEDVTFDKLVDVLKEKLGVTIG